MTHCNIHFRVKYFTEFEETVKVLGNIDALGNWDPSKGLELTTTPHNYPFWMNETPIEVPSGTTSIRSH